ncbi:MAG: type VI secretion system tip protein VgrG [Proteobacteria bacterium]|nr:type VI secretion system tip protein VgrG [Pseudomonadota bacterium]
MAIDETKRFTFVSQGLPEDTFSVVKFKGTEGISKLYEFDITLASDDGEINLKGVLQNPATLTIKGGDQDLPIHGAVAEFKQLNEVKGHYFYRALLVPRLRQADLYHENQLFLDKKVPDIIEEILKQAGLTTQDYELKLTRNYPQWEYICQYRETDFDFICRWMEREGIYYYFEQGEQSEKIIITDSSTAHKDIPGDATIPYFTASGLAPEEEAIKAFVCTQKMLPKKVIIKDYNYRKPSLELKAEAEVDSRGRGDVYLYGEHFKDPGQGNELAKIRAEEIKCRENMFHGEGTAPSLCPGFFFTLDGHYRDSYNQKYLILEVEHEGHQTGAFWAGVGKEPAEGEEKLTYANRFSAIPSDSQFRPERTTPKSKFFGTMNATVDAAGDGQHAEIDDQGRYKLILPFDQSGNKDGKASRWVRMAQPYAGSEYGIHFPLHKGAEVLLTFVDGDPDRPIISGSMPNPETTSPVTSANQTKSIVRDNFGNEMIFDATPGDEHIRLYSPHHDSGLELGRSAFKYTTSDDADLAFGNKIEGVIGNKIDFLGGYKVEGMVGSSFNALVGLDYNFTWAGSMAWNFGFKSDFSLGSMVEDSNKDILFTSNQDFIIGAGDEFCLAAGTQEPDSAKNQNKNKSVMRATPDGVTLSIGNELTETGEGIGDGDWYRKTTKWDRLKPGLPILSAMTGIAAMITSSLHEKSGKEAGAVSFVPLTILGATINVWAFIFAWMFYENNLSDVKIEPVRHKLPKQKIWLHRDGTVGIISTKGEGNALDGKKGRIVIGVNKQEEGEKKDWWRYYDKYYDFPEKKKDRDTFFQNVKKARALIKQKKGGELSEEETKQIDLVKQKIKRKKLGEGSNIVIERDKIWLRSGEPGKESLEIIQDNESQSKRIGLYTYNPNKKAEKALIAIWQDSGTISLDNKKRNGMIALESKKQIKLKTDDHIFIKAGGQKQIYIKSKAAFSGAIEHPSFKALK